MKTTSGARLRQSLKASEIRLRNETGHPAADGWLHGVAEGDRCSVNVAYRWDEIARKREATGEITLCGHRKKRHKDGYCLDCRRLVRHHDFRAASYALPPRSAREVSTAALESASGSADRLSSRRF